MNSNLNADFNTIFELDLDPIKVKLMHKESGEGWTRAQVDSVAFEYRRFLHLMKLYPNEQVAPLFDVDIFWHYHILDTMKYAEDCQHIFGYFLHHFPYSGLRGEDDEAVHQQIGARMQELYEMTYGRAYIRQADDAAVAAASGQTAWSQPATPTIAWSQPATPQAGMATTDWSQPAMPQAGTAKTAWSQPAVPQAGMAKTAWSQPAVPKTAWSQPTAPMTARPQSIAPNDRLYSRPVLAMAA